MVKVKLFNVGSVSTAKRYLTTLKGVVDVEILGTLLVHTFSACEDSIVMHHMEEGGDHSFTYHLSDLRHERTWAYGSKGQAR